MIEILSSFRVSSCRLKVICSLYWQKKTIGYMVSLNSSPAVNGVAMCSSDPQGAIAYRCYCV